MNTPRLPPPFLVVIVSTLEPLPSIRSSERATIRLFPFPACLALMVLTPVALVIVNVAVPVCFDVLLWLSARLEGLTEETHCGIGVAVGDATGDGEGVGVGVGPLRAESVVRGAGVGDGGI